jgi:hypothetical protein
MLLFDLQGVAIFLLSRAIAIETQARSWQVNVAEIVNSTLI